MEDEPITAQSTQGEKRAYTTGHKKKTAAKRRCAKRGVRGAQGFNLRGFLAGVRKGRESSRGKRYADRKATFIGSRHGGHSWEMKEAREVQKRISLTKGKGESKN